MADNGSTGFLYGYGVRKSRSVISDDNSSMIQMVSSCCQVSGKILQQPPKQGKPLKQSVFGFMKWLWAFPGFSAFVVNHRHPDAIYYAFLTILLNHFLDVLITISLRYALTIPDVLLLRVRSLFSSWCGVSSCIEKVWWLVLVFWFRWGLRYRWLSVYGVLKSNAFRNGKSILMGMILLRRYL